MRRIILLVTAFIVTFGVFANGPMTATAPSLASVFGHFDSSAVKETAVTYIMPRPQAKPQPAPAAAPVQLATELQMTEIATLDLSIGQELVPALSESSSAIENEGWVTLAYGAPEVTASAHAEPAVKSGSKAMSNPVFSGRILSKPAQLHRAAGRSNAMAQGKRSIFEPVTAQLRVETADGRSPALKLGGNATVRTIAKQRISAAAHTIAFAETPEAINEIAADSGIETAGASDRPVFMQAAFRSEPEMPAVRQNTRVFVPTFSTAPAVDQFVIKMGSAVSYNDTSSVASFLSATAGKAVFNADAPAPPARIIRPEPVAAIHEPQFYAAAEVIDTLDLSVLPTKEKPLGSRIRSGSVKGEIFAKAKANTFTARDVTASLSHPVLADLEITSAGAETRTENAVMPEIAETNVAGTIVPEFEVAKNDPNVWLSSYATTSPEFTAASLDKPKAVASAPKRAAVVVTGMTSLNIAPMKRAADGGYCDPNYIGDPIRFSQTAQLTLEDLLLQIHNRFGINFIIGNGVSNLPMNIKAGSIPWNVLLKSQLFISGVRARCIDQNTIELVENTTLPSLQDMADVDTRFVKLKFLQRTTNSAVGLSGQSQSSQNGGQGGCGGQGGGSGGNSGGGGGGQGGGQNGETAAQLGSSKFDKLIIEIEKILGLRSMQESSVGSMGGQGGQGGTQQQQSEAVRSNRYVTQVPGRNILAIRATKEEHELIDQIIARADRPPFQVVIKGLVYTANQDRLQDIGVQTTITGGTADGRTTGGVFGHTLGALGTLFDFSTVIGTFDFNVQANAFQQNGVISIKSRPFATVVDGLCTTLDVGKTILIPIDGGINGTGNLEEREASNTLAVAPYVVDDEFGNPIAVTLDLTLTANELDETVTTRGVPAISTRSISTQLLLEKDQTAILGGFTVDQDRRSVSKTPGLGDIPLIGELFKRRVKDLRVQRLYFAITASVIRYGEAIRPVDVPGATTDPPSITPEQKLRSDKAEQPQVKGP